MNVCICSTTFIVTEEKVLSPIITYLGGVIRLPGYLKVEKSIDTEVLFIIFLALIGKG